MRGESPLGIGMLIGSNISDIGFVLAITVLLTRIELNRKEFRELFETVLISSIILFFLFSLGRTDSNFGLFVFIIFGLVSFGMVKEGYIIREEGDEYEFKVLETVRAVLLCLFFSLLVVLSSKVLTDAAIEIASAINVTESFIGLTIIALGTSLPELAVGLAAIAKRNINLAIGDLLGSLITNLTLGLGMASILNPIVLGHTVKTSILALLGFNTLFLIFAWDMKFSIKEGLALLFCYIAFLFSLFIIL